MGHRYEQDTLKNMHEPLIHFTIILQSDDYQGRDYQILELFVLGRTSLTGNSNPQSLLYISSYNN